VSCNRSSFINSRASGVLLESREATEDLSPGREPWDLKALTRLPSPAGQPAGGHLTLQSLWAAGRERKGEREGGSTQGSEGVRKSAGADLDACEGAADP
jgi:hypothetical protein